MGAKGGDGMTQPLSASLEDYLEVILHLSDQSDGAKISDIAQRLDIAKPSVSQAIAVLKADGFVSQQPYGPVQLTEKGRVRANKIWYKHQIIRDYFITILGVSPENADRDACLIEHLLSEESFKKMEARLKQAVERDTT